MEQRGQFTFYRSFWDAIQILPQKDQLPLLRAVISYALDGEEISGLTQHQRASFLLIKPTLDSARKKAASGKQGGSKSKANASKPQANASEKEREKEKEGEIEKEIEKENECYISLKTEGANTVDGIGAPPFDGRLFTEFWNNYPAGKGGDREEAWKAWRELAPTAEVANSILVGLQDWIDSDQWAEKGGRYIPGAAKFLIQKRWLSPPSMAAPVQDGEDGPYSDTLAYYRKLLDEREKGVGLFAK